MRAAGIIRIIVGLILAALLTAILVVLLTGQSIFSRLGWDGGWVNNIIERATYTYGGVNSDTNEIIVSEEAKVPADSIEKIKIDWVSGKVNLVVGSDSEIVFYETSYRTLTDRQKMRYSISESGTLQIRYCQDLDNIFDWFDLDRNMPSKELTMEVPAALMETLRELEVDTVSASINLNGVYGSTTELDTVSGEIECLDVTANDLSMDSTSGSVVCENTRAQTLDVDSVSGSIRAEGEFGEVDVDSTSGSTRLNCVTAPRTIDVDSVSGSATIALPESAGFTARLDSVSGSISCDFPGTLGENSVVVGDGSANYRFNTVSGSIRIEKN